MKFGKRLRTQIEDTLPDWQDKFLNYKDLKKRLKSISAPECFTRAAYHRESTAGAPTEAGTPFGPQIVSPRLRAINRPRLRAASAGLAEGGDRFILFSFWKRNTPLSSSAASAGSARRGHFSVYSNLTLHSRDVHDVRALSEGRYTCAPLCLGFISTSYLGR
jgi:hypothetical protein